MTEIHRLSNGLRVAVDAMPGLQSASLGLWTDAGARHESKAENGVAHLLEHMAFKGTATRSARQIVEEIESVGGSLNASTSYERTAYTARALSEHARLALELIADIVCNSTFDAEEFERERTVVLQEIGEARDTPDDRVFDNLQLAEWGDAPMGRPIAGDETSVNGLTRDGMIAFHARHYRPENMVISAAGGVDANAILADVERLFGDMAPGEASKKADKAEAVRWVGGERRERKKLEETHIALALPGVSAREESYYAIRLLTEIYGGGMSSRLFQTVREERGLAYSIYAFHDSYIDAGALGVYAAADRTRLEGLIPVIVGELAALADGPTAAEIDRGKAQMKAGLLMARETPAARADIAAGQVFLFDREVTPREMVEKLEAVTAEDVAVAARAALSGGRLSLSVLGELGGLEDYDALDGLRG